jgi:hypothetical protein
MSFILLGILNSQVAGGGAGAYDLLETQILTSSASSVTFTGLDTLASGYQHLQIRSVVRNDSFADNLFIRMNGVTSTSYARHRLRGNGTAVQSAAGFSDTRISGIEMSTSSDDANIFSPSVIDILDFSSSSKNTTLRALYGKNPTNTLIGLVSGLFVNTAAVTSIELYADANMAIGSRFSLYGIRGE